MISTSKIGCHIGVIAVNIFAYADDVVLLAASWQAMQGLGLAVNCCKDLDLECNAKKMKCMVVNPSDSSKICLLYTSPSPRDRTRSRMPSSA